MQRGDDYVRLSAELKASWVLRHSQKKMNCSVGLGHTEIETKVSIPRGFEDGQV